MVAKEAKTFSQKIRGLIGSPKPYPLLLQTRWGIHTFGMRYAIDVIVVDKENTIVKIKQNLKPNKIFLWNPRYTTVIELPEGTIRKQKLSLRGKIKIELSRQ